MNLDDKQVLTESHQSIDFLSRETPLLWEERAELDVMRHMMFLAGRNFSIDQQFYPLGSCTMKYNPRIAHRLTMLPQLAQLHPLLPSEEIQGVLQCLWELQEILGVMTGLPHVTLAPMAGAQGEWLGIAMIRAYHEQRGDQGRTEILVPDAAHGTNPASAVMCGYRVKEIPTGVDGDLDMAALKAAVGPQTAGIMLTNPSTLGVCERFITEIAALIHDAGGLLYYDGANLNAILGRYSPGQMGFDVVHLNLHKTFATPHGGGGPGSGPVAVSDRLASFLPYPRIAQSSDGDLSWTTKSVESVGRLSAFMGNIGVLMRAYIYIRRLGREGCHRVSSYATLNAHYLARRLSDIGYPLAFPDRLASHEFVITLKEWPKRYGVTAGQVAKRMLDYGVHAPTMYFPLNVPECLLIEPTETESKATLDAFIVVMEKIIEEVRESPELVREAPHTLPVRRLDEVKAVRELTVTAKS